MRALILYIFCALLHALFMLSIIEHNHHQNTTTKNGNGYTRDAPRHARNYSTIDHHHARDNITRLYFTPIYNTRYYNAVFYIYIYVYIRFIYILFFDSLTTSTKHTKTTTQNNEHNAHAIFIYYHAFYTCMRLLFFYHFLILSHACIYCTHYIKE